MSNNVAIIDAMRAIADANDGTLTPDLVIEAARDPASPLHSEFTWDRDEAAYERWRDQARALIGKVRIEIRTTEYSFEVPRYVRDPTVHARVQGYTSLDRLRRDREAAREAVMAEFVRASGALARAKHLAVALGLADEIEALRERVSELAERAQQEGTPEMASA